MWSCTSLDHFVGGSEGALEILLNLALVVWIHTLLVHLGVLELLVLQSRLLDVGQAAPKLLPTAINQLHTRGTPAR